MDNWEQPGELPFGNKEEESETMKINFKNPIP
jgi:hypothetical protein